MTTEPKTTIIPAGVGGWDKSKPTPLNDLQLIMMQLQAVGMKLDILSEDIKELKSRLT